MQPYLFPGTESKKPSRSKYEKALLRYDEETFPDRLERLQYLNKIYPKGLAFGSDAETVFVFDEAKMSFINGEFISTILLTQAFVERWLQQYFDSKGQKKLGKEGLKKMTEYARANDLVPQFILGKIDEMRVKRNPFVHLKHFDHEHTLNQRMMKSIRNENAKTYYEIMLEDAKEAISLMYTILVTRLD